MSEKVLVRRLVGKYNAGDIICQEGDDGRDMFIIKTGKIEIYKEIGNEAIILATLGPKEFFGEMALFGVNKRTASVRAVVPSEVIIVTKKMLETQYMKVPDWLVSMIKTIANRIISTSKGVKVPFKVSLHFSMLKAILYLCKTSGTRTKKGYCISAQTLRDEIKYTLGIHYDEIDVWLKKFNLVNLLRPVPGKGLMEIPDMERYKSFVDYLYFLTPEGKESGLEFNPHTTQGYERVNKLLLR